MTMFKDSKDLLWLPKMNDAYISSESMLTQDLDRAPVPTRAVLRDVSQTCCNPNALLWHIDMETSTKTPGQSINLDGMTQYRDGNT